MMADEFNDRHFNKVFWYIVGTTGFACMYLAAITFIQIPFENVRFADTILGFLLGTLVGGGASYLWGGTPPAAKKRESDSSVTTAEISATITKADDTDKNSNQ